MDDIDLAKEGLEKSHHAVPDTLTRRSAMLIAVLSSAAVIAEMSANDAQTAYLGKHIAASDTWTQYQAKSIRRTIYLQSAELLTATRGKKSGIAAAQREAARMKSEPEKDGMDQLAAQAQKYQIERNQNLHLYDGLERGVRGLQIAIVLTSLFLATRMQWLLVIGAVLGGCSALFALAVGTGFI